MLEYVYKKLRSSQKRRPKTSTEVKEYGKNHQKFGKIGLGRQGN